MSLVFEENLTIEPDSEAHRTCSICERRKPFEEFYKDGKNKDGTTRRRRDCKLCYKRSRDDEKALKNPVTKAPLRNKRGGKKK